MIRILRRFAAVIFLIVSVGLIVWAQLPNQHQMINQTITPGMMQLLADEQDATPLSIPTREIQLEWPTRIHIGEKESIILSFIPAQSSPVSADSHDKFANIYNEYSLMAEGKYDVAGLKVNPANPTRESMPAGQPLTFRWQISADQEGTYDGVVWLSLRYLPLDGSQAIQVPIFIRDINIEETSLLGLNESMVTILGVVGIFLSIVLVYDDLIRVIYMWKKNNH